VSTTRAKVSELYVVVVDLVENRAGSVNIAQGSALQIVQMAT
jgi:hypothetical protein